ncbi:MAG: CocE/NonD family hydrolase [Candidatus Thermoplasmatota archaeon]
MKLAATLSVCLATFALLSGCAQSTPPEAAPMLEGLEIPSGATQEPASDGIFFRFGPQALPFSTAVKIPAGATMVRAVAEGVDGASVSMSHQETGRRRCNNPTVEDFSTGWTSPVSCSGLAAVDAPGAFWNVNFGGSGTADLRIEVLTRPLDGLVAQLDLSLLDPPILGLEPTKTEFISSFDGTLLRTETTLPTGGGRWPAVIVSSPYNDDGVRATPADWTYVVQDWAKRGYAMVAADVRGFGDSGGCVEVWGINEQRDQLALVEWVASQPWSDGNVGFYGQSYVGTTPVEAAVQAPPALKAIISVAPVINAYEDWHYGGVPNGESSLSPVAYQVLTEGTTGAAGTSPENPPRTDPAQLANNAANGLCDPLLVTRSNDPRATYGPFYAERNFKLRAGDVTAAVLYTQGFEDANVKGNMIPGWFNELTAPKLGLFGHWLHQHPPRMDTEALMLAWLEQYLKGDAIGLENLPKSAIVVDRATQRLANEWPPTAGHDRLVVFGADLDVGTLVEGDGSGSPVTLALDHSGAASGAAIVLDQVPGPESLLTFTGTLTRDVSLAGVGRVALEGSLTGTNAYLGAYLYVNERLVTWGQLNLAHNEDHTTYTPIVPGTRMEWSIPLRPTEVVLRADSTLRLEVRGVQVAEATDPFGLTALSLDIHQLGLELPGAPLANYSPLPLTAIP